MRHSDLQTAPKYQQIQDYFREAIRAGRLLPSEKVASIRQLASEFGVNRHTVMAALQQLVAEGWIVSKERSGYFVERTLPVEGSIKQQTVKGFEPLTPHFAYPLDHPVTSEVNEFKFHFGGGLPDILSFPYDSFRRSLSVVCRGANSPLFHYGAVSGVPALKTEILRYLRKARGAQFDDVLVCNGSQEALFLIATAFLRKGDKVAVESLGYPPARKAFAAMGAELVGISQDVDGINVDHFERELKRGGIKLLYLTPLHQYPTCVTLSVAKRLAIYQLCYRYGVFIVEDDYDHEFHYACQPLQPMAANDPAGIVVYLSTFSKVMFAGCRTGYVCASAAVLTQLVALKQLMNHRNDALMQLAIGHWMAAGHFERHLKKMTKCYRLRRDAMSGALEALNKSGNSLTWQLPDGGMALWVDTGRDISGLKAKAAKAGIYVQTEDEFQLVKSPNATHIRLGFAGQTEQAAQKGLERLFSLW